MTDSTAPEEIKSFFERWVRLEEAKKEISEDLKELFKESSSRGYGSKELRTAFRRKIKEDEANPADAEFEAVVDIYLDALNAPKDSMRDARMRARENIEKFDAETGEIVDDAEQASVGIHSAAFTPMAALGTEESAATNSPETVIEGPKVLDGRSGDGPESRHHTVVSEDEAGQNLTSDIIQAKKPLRPHCMHPGEETCGGYGDRHCGECLRLHVSSKSEVAA